MKKQTTMLNIWLLLVRFDRVTKLTRLLRNKSMKGELDTRIGSRTKTKVS